MLHALLTPRFAHRSIRPFAAALVALAAVAAMLALPARAPAVGLPPGCLLYTSPSPRDS